MPWKFTFVERLCYQDIISNSVLRGRGINSLASHSLLVRATPGLLNERCSKQEAGSTPSVWLDGEQLVWAATSQTQLDVS